MWRSFATDSLVLLLTVFAPAAVTAAPPTPREMATQIDQHLAKVWTENKVEPGPISSDAEFLRRAWLDLTGIIPPLNERALTAKSGNFGVLGFLANPSPDKRFRLIDYLLDKPRHATHLTTLWRNAMLPRNNNVQLRFRDQGFKGWLRQQFAGNRRYNDLVKDLLLARGAPTVGPALYFTSLGLKPEDIAANSSRFFLGVQIQCAQCHDHPFDHWTRKDFWGYAAFFGRLPKPRNANTVLFQNVQDMATGEIKFPESKKVVKPQFLGGKVSLDRSGGNRRQRLVEWIVAKNNPFFARASVNRIWALLFGRGLVHPIDDMGKHNKASHPELLDDLAQYFVATDYDLRNLIKTIAYTRAYQLSSVNKGGEEQAALFARMSIKSLTAEQLYDCLIEAVRRRSGTRPNTNRQFFSARGGYDANRMAFVNKFRAPTQGATDYQSGIPQALTMMNGSLIRQITGDRRSDLLAILEAPFFTDKQRIDTLFLSTLTRKPTKTEKEKFLA